MNSRAVETEPEVKKGTTAANGSHASAPPVAEVEKQSFAETALKLGGKSEEEARRTGAIDKADDQVEALFAPQYQTVNSPAHRAVWDGETPINEFISATPQTPPHVQKVMDDSLAVVRKHVQAGTLLNNEAKRGISKTVLDELGSVGYWGLLVEQRVRRLGRAILLVCPVPHQDGHDRRHRGRHGQRSRLHRRGRPGEVVRQPRAEEKILAALGQWPAAFGLRPDRAQRRL